MPRVSVLLTCYNHIAYLSAALKSVRDQTFTDLEIIAIDDGSTDGAREWLSDQRELNLIFNERNLGTYETLNVGLRRASGEFIAILNDDDLWAPEKLERQIRLMEAHPEVGLVHTGGGFIDGEGQSTEGNPLGFRFPTFETGDILTGLVYENKIIASAAFVRRACFDRVGDFDPAYFGSGDWQMWFRIAEVYKAGFVEGALTSYRVHGANASHKLERIWKDDQRLREWMAPRLEDLDNRCSTSDARKARAFNFAALGTVRSLNGDPLGARAAYQSSLKQDPWRVKTYLRYLASYLPASQFRKTL